MKKNHPGRGHHSDKQSTVLSDIRRVRVQTLSDHLTGRQAVKEANIDSIESACQNLSLTSVFWASKFNWISPLPTGDAINH